MTATLPPPQAPVPPQDRPAPPAPALCPCGSQADPELADLATVFPSVSVLCPACYAATREADSRRAAAAAAAAAAELAASRLSVIPPRIRETDMGDRRFNAAAYLWIQEWSPDSRQWLGIVGPPGTCKTRILGLFAARLIAAGSAVTWISAVEFETLVADEGVRGKDPRLIRQREKASRLIRAAREADVLVFDDLGKNGWHPALARHLFHLFDHRSSHYKLTLWSSNLPVETMAAEAAPVVGDALAGPLFGRLIEASSVFVLKGR